MLSRFTNFRFFLAGSCRSPLVCRLWLTQKRKSFAVLAKSCLANSQNITMATPVRKTKKKPSLVSRAIHSVRWLLGLVFASTFSLTYFVVPFYMITALLALTFGYPCRHASWLYASPLLISAIVPPIPMPFLLKLLRPILDYFEFEEIHENSPVDLRTECIDNGKNYLCVFQPHGALSYTAIASIVNAPPEFQGMLQSRVQAE